MKPRGKKMVKIIIIIEENLWNTCIEFLDFLRVIN